MLFIYMYIFVLVSFLDVVVLVVSNAVIAFDYLYMIDSSVSHLLLIINLNSQKQIQDFEKGGSPQIGHISCCEFCCTKRGPTLRTPSGSATSFVIQANNQDITCFVPAKVLIRWLMATTTGWFFSHFDINYFVYWLETQSRHLPDNFPVNNNFSTIFGRSVIHCIICHPSKIHANISGFFINMQVASMGTWRDRVSNQYTLKQNNSNM